MAGLRGWDQRRIALVTNHVGEHARFFFQAEDGIRVRDGLLEFRRVLFRSHFSLRQRPAFLLPISCCGSAHAFYTYQFLLRQHPCFFNCPFLVAAAPHFLYCPVLVAAAPRFLYCPFLVAAAPPLFILPFSRCGRAPLFILPGARCGSAPAFYIPHFSFRQRPPF